jgi:hypothetical protein
MHVLFVEPRFPANQPEFVRGLHAAGARVTGIGEAPADALGPVLGSWLHGYEQVSSVCDEGAMLATVRRIQAREWVDRLEATIEAHILPVAKVRETATIPGTSVKTAFLCRDKPAMKKFLRQHGIATAASDGVSSPEEARSFAARVGYPIILKPRSGAGAAGTDRIGSDEELEAAIRAHGIDRGQSVAAEEFVEGHEGFFDTLTVDGEVVHEFISHYYPGVLEAMRNRWITPYVITTNRIDAPGYEEVRRMGRKVIRELGMGTSASHMEWFYGPKGLKFSEIGCRPPGVSVWDLYSASNDFDIYREWGMTIAHGRSDAKLSRRFSAALVALRPSRDGRVAGYEGLEAIHRRYGEWILDSHLPPPGQPTQPIEAGYMANGWIRLRHPDYDALRGICDEIGRSVRVHAE